MPQRAGTLHDLEDSGHSRLAPAGRDSRAASRQASWWSSSATWRPLRRSATLPPGCSSSASTLTTWYNLLQNRCCGSLHLLITRLDPRPPLNSQSKESLSSQAPTTFFTVFSFLMLFRTAGAERSSEVHAQVVHEGGSRNADGCTAIVHATTSMDSARCGGGQCRSCSHAATHLLVCTPQV